MRIAAVEFSDFRNYRTLSFAPAPALNILTGPNAQGKTNLLEGLALLLVGRSFRGARAAELPSWGVLEAVVRGDLRRDGMARALHRVVAPREDGTWAVSGEGCPWARAIPFGWQDLALFTGGPQARRGFLDGFAGKLHPAHLAVQARYRRVLARRNHLLQSGLDRGGLRGLLAPWDEQLAALGLELTARRRAATAALGLEAARLFPTLAGQGTVEVTYRASLEEGVVAADVRARLEAGLPEEARRGQTLLGPHRDDLTILLDGRDLRVYGSRGQQRLMALVLRLAEAEPVAAAVGSPPVLVLDDALSELDPAVRARALAHVAGAGQVFLTTAEPELPDAAGAVWWEVQGGRVSDASLAAVGGAA